MTRYLFAPEPIFTTPTSTAVAVGANQPFELYDSRVGGTKITDCTAPDGTTALPVVAGKFVADLAGQPAAFRGPHGVVSLWIDAGNGTRYQVIATDLLETTLEAAISWLVSGIGSGSGAALDDTSTGNQTTWSSSNIATKITALLTRADFLEAVEDRIGGMVSAAGGTYDDTAGAIALPSGATNDQASTSSTVALSAAATKALITALLTRADFLEAVEDRIGALVTGAGGTYNDTAGSITLPSGGASLTSDSTSTSTAQGLTAAAAQTAALGKVMSGRVDAMLAPYLMSSTKTAVQNGAALQQAIIDAGKRPVTFSGELPCSGVKITDQDVVIDAPHGWLLQPQGADPILTIERTPATPIGVSPTDLVWWGPFQPSGVTVGSLLQRIPATGTQRFKGGHVYHICSRDIYPWAWSGINIADYSTSDGLATQAEEFELLGIGFTVNSVSNGGPLEQMMVQGSTSGSTGLVASTLFGSATSSGAGGPSATMAQITFQAVSGDFVAGENLVRIAGGNPTYNPTGGAIATVGQVVGVVAEAPYLLTTDLFVLQYGRTSAAQATTGTATPNRTDNTVQLREVDTEPLTILDVGIDTVGDRDLPDTYVTDANRSEGIIIRAPYAPQVTWRVRNSWTRALSVWTSFMGTYDGRVTQMPNHAMLDQSAFAYGLELKSASKGNRITLQGHSVRHLFTTNPNQRTYAAANDNSAGKWTQWDYGTPIRNVVHDSVVYCAYAPGMDTHPGDYYTTFVDTHVYFGGSGGRYNTDNNAAFSSRGFGTKWVDCEAHGSGVGWNFGGVEHNAGINYRAVLQGCRVNGAVAQAVYCPAAKVPGQCTIEIDGGSYAGTVSYVDGTGTTQLVSARYNPDALIQIGSGVDLLVRGGAQFRRFVHTWLRKLGTGTVTIESAFVDYTDSSTSASGLRAENGAGTVGVYNIVELNLAGTVPVALRNFTGDNVWNVGTIRGLGTSPLYLTSAGSPTYNKTTDTTTSVPVTQLSTATGAVTLHPRTNGPSVEFSTTLTGNVTATLSTAVLINGDTLTVYRSAGGAFTLTVGGVTLAQGQAAMFRWNGTAWAVIVQPGAGGVGTAGADGATWYTGAGAPGTITGQKTGDLYLNTANGDVYRYASSAWSVVSNIRGSNGAPGAGGAQVYTAGIDADVAQPTASANVSDLAALQTSLPVGTYLVDAVLYVVHSATAAGALRFGLGGAGSAGASVSNYEVDQQTNTNAATRTPLTALSVSGTTATLGTNVAGISPAATSVLTYKVRGKVTVTAAGVLGLVWQMPTSATATATLKAGSYIDFTKINAPVDPTTPPAAQPLGVPGRWTLDFSDEFNGTTLDTTKWVNLDGYSMNNVTARAANVSVSGGLLRLALSSQTDGSYISSNRDSIVGQGYLVGVGSYMEVRAYFPGDANGAFNWAAAWARGAGPATTMLEVDFAEVLGANGVTDNIHYGNPESQKNLQAPPGTWQAGFHVYGFYWRNGWIDFYRDGRFTHAVALGSVAYTAMSMLLNNGVTGSTTGVLGAAGAFLVDWVRVWTRDYEPAFVPVLDKFEGGQSPVAPPRWTQQGVKGTVTVDSAGRMVFATPSGGSGSIAAILTDMEPVAGCDVVATLGIATTDTQYHKLGVRCDHLDTSVGDAPYNGYFVEIQPGSSQWLLKKAVNGVSTVLATVTGYTFSATVAPIVCLQALSVSGTQTVRARVWQTGASEPTTWPAAVADSSIAMGRVLISAQNGGAAAQTLAVDNVYVTSA